MNDAIRVRTYSRVKEAMATGAFPAETGASQIPEVIVAQSEGRLDFRDAERISAMRAMGKANNLFRNGKAAEARGTVYGALVVAETERNTVLDYLWRMLRDEVTSEGKPRWRFTNTTFICLAAVAADELCFDACETCSGARVVPLDYANAPKEGRMPMVECSACHGTGKRTYTAAERAESIAKAWAIMLHTPDEWPGLRDEIKAGAKLPRFQDVIEWGKGKLLEAERLATEGAVQMLGRL